MPKSQSKLGDINRNGQRLIEKTSHPGNDHMQHVWIVECTRPVCTGGYRYGVNSSDFFQRKCPRCQGGEPGLSIEGIADA